MLKDEAEKARRGYRDPRTIVRMDGTEKLYGKDWTCRKQELAARSGGRCEWINSDNERCRSAGRDPHHIIERSKHRDDRLTNLLAVCPLHHDRFNWRRLHWSVLTSSSKV